MKNLLLTLICVLLAALVSAQNVGIGASSFTPETDAILELRSTTTGFLMPRMTDAQMTAISGPTEGLLVYQTNATKGFKYFDGSVWTSFGGASGSDNFGNHTADQNIRLGDFWLSNDGGNEGIRVTNDGKVGIGLSNPAKELDVNGHMRLGGLAGSGNQMMVVDNGGNVFAQELPAAPLWSTNGVDVYRSSGKVGIGTSSPSTKLEVNGDARITDLAGSGIRMVVADADGDLSTQALPTSGSTPTTVFATADASVSSSSYVSGSVSGMSISSVPAGSYVVSFNADISRSGSTACQCVVRVGGTDDSNTERSMEIPAAKSQFHLMGKVTLASSGTIEIRCKKNSVRDLQSESAQCRYKQQTKIWVFNTS
jgi:hypothetical protein